MFKKEAVSPLVSQTHYRRKTRQSNFITYGILLIAFIIAEVWMRSGKMSSHMKGMLIPLCMYSILAVSLNLVVGILGDLSLGHAGFMCIGAFSGALFSVCTKNAIQNTGLRFFLAILIGGLFAAVFGALIGIPVLRLSGDYLAIVTLAFGEIIKNIFGSVYFGFDSKGPHFSFVSTSNLGLDPNGTVLISGPLGISSIPKNSSFEISALLLFITVIVTLNFIHSRSGRAAMALRDNQIAARSIGVNMTKYKLIAFSLSAFFAGIAGVIYSHNLNALQATSKNFGYNMSIMILVFVVLGGIGNIRGSVIAACVLTALPEVLREYNKYRMIIYSVLLIVMMILSSSKRALAFFEKIKAPLKRKTKTPEKGREEEEAAKE